MELTPEHRESLTELINIGYGRAASALSELTGRRIVLDVPKVDVFPVERVGKALSEVMRGEVASVHQVFSGPVSGNALLLLDRDAAMLLNSLLLDQPVSSRLDAAGREALIEVGNIVLNACLGVFGNLLQNTLRYTESPAKLRIRLYAPARHPRTGVCAASRGIGGCRSGRRAREG